MHGLEVAAGGQMAALGEQAMDALGAGEQVGVGRCEGQLAGLDVEDELAQRGRGGEVGAEVEQVQLPDPGTGAGGARDAEGEVGGLGVPYPNSGKSDKIGLG